MTDELLNTRNSLLLRLKQHDGDAWREFIEIYEQALIRYCRSRGLQDADAQDATQEVLAAVHDRIASWNCDTSQGSLRAWLFRVARNIAVDTLRRRARQATASGDTAIGQMLAEVPSAADASVFHLEYRRATFQWAADQIRPGIREITWQSFWLTAVEGMPAEQVAAKLQVSVGTVYTSKCRVMARIRAKVAEMHDPDNEIPQGKPLR